MIVEEPCPLSYLRLTNYTDTYNTLPQHSSYVFFLFFFNLIGTVHSYPRLAECLHFARASFICFYSIKEMDFALCVPLCVYSYVNTSVSIRVIFLIVPPVIK